MAAWVCGGQWEDQVAPRTQPGFQRDGDSIHGTSLLHLNESQYPHGSKDFPGTEEMIPLRRAH